MQIFSETDPRYPKAAARTVRSSIEQMDYMNMASNAVAKTSSRRKSDSEKVQRMKDDAYANGVLDAYFALVDAGIDPVDPGIDPFAADPLAPVATPLPAAVPAVPLG